MDPASLIIVLKAGAVALAEGALNKVGEEIYFELKNTVKRFASNADVEALERNPQSEDFKRVLIKDLAVANALNDKELAHLERLQSDLMKQLSLIERQSISKALRDSKVDLIPTRVFEMFERH
jgi:hypothetical protein